MAPTSRRRFRSSCSACHGYCIDRPSAVYRAVTSRERLLLRTGSRRASGESRGRPHAPGGSRGSSSFLRGSVHQMIPTNNAKPSAISIANQIMFRLSYRPATSISRLTLNALLLLSICSCTSLPKTGETKATSKAPAPASPPPAAPQPAVKPPLAAQAATTTPSVQSPPICPAHCTSLEERKPAINWASSLKPTDWSMLPAWNGDRVQDALAAFLKGCAKLLNQVPWRAACAAAEQADRSTPDAARRFLETNFAPYSVVNPDGSVEGQITGYYEALLRGSRTPSATYRFPLYAPPDDMLTVDLGELYPDLKPMRLRGRLDGRRVVPYFSRADIESGKATLNGRALLWTDDLVDLFFLHIQGSGKVLLDTGEVVRVSYADQNGHPYKSIGRLLVERGELTLDQASMDGIRAWGTRNSERLAALLNENPSYVFFRELPAN